MTLLNEKSALAKAMEYGFVGTLATNCAIALLRVQAETLNEVLPFVMAGFDKADVRRQLRDTRAAIKRLEVEDD